MDRISSKRIKTWEKLPKSGIFCKRSLHQEESPKKDLPIVGGKNTKLIMVDCSQKPNLIQKKRTNRNVCALQYYSFPTFRILTLLVFLFFVLYYVIDLYL